jgi:hypothetical protein
MRSNAAVAAARIWSSWEDGAGHDVLPDELPLLEPDELPLLEPDELPLELEELPLELPLPGRH